MNGEGAKNFGNVTRQIAGQGRYIPIFLDERCISAPTVQSPIPNGQGQISGGFRKPSKKRANWRCCSIPARCRRRLMSLKTAPFPRRWDKDSLTKSLHAGLIGLGIVALVYAGVLPFARSTRGLRAGGFLRLEPGDFHSGRRHFDAARHRRILAGDCDVARYQHSGLRAIARGNGGSADLFRRACAPRSRAPGRRFSILTSRR